MEPLMLLSGGIFSEFGISPDAAEMGYVAAIVIVIIIVVPI
ncbi:MAG: hypothetical protein WAV89_08995 [Ignavibacteriaceae bacterium]|jgi:hypothetical protein